AETEQRSRSGAGWRSGDGAARSERDGPGLQSDATPGYADAATVCVTATRARRRLHPGLYQPARGARRRAALALFSPGRGGLLKPRVEPTPLSLAVGLMIAASAQPGVGSRRLPRPLLAGRPRRRRNPGW